MSVLIVYRKRVLALAAGALRGRPDSLRYVGLLALASVPAAVAGLGFGGFLESLFDRPAVAGAALVVTGCIVWSARSALAGEPSGSVGAGTALVMGAAQAFAIVPGLSRSGATVVAALWRGADPREAAAFSFLMSVPAVGGAAMLKLGDAAADGAVGGAALLVAAVTACVSGIVAVRVFHAMLRNRSFHVFAPYLWVAGALFLAMVLT